MVLAITKVAENHEKAYSMHCHCNDREWAALGQNPLKFSIGLINFYKPQLYPNDLMVISEDPIAPDTDRPCAPLQSGKKTSSTAEAIHSLHVHWDSITQKQYIYMG